MKVIIQATSVIGCSLSLMFCLLAVIVLACYREKTLLLLIKQQQSITLVFINIVMLTGFQGMGDEKLCQTATSLLHYFVLACFSWLTADQYFIFKSVVKTKPYVNFMKLFIAAWGFPIPFLVMQLLVGFLLDEKIGSVLYTCWGSDLVALTLLIPAGGLSLASITMLSITVKSVIKRPAPTTYTRRKTDEAIKYGIKTSSVMIFITVIVWIFAHLLFWHPQVIDFQLIFALSSALQGLFNFFFYCVFALELDIYVSDKLFSEIDDVDEFARNTGSVKLSSINRQDIQNMESLRRPQQSKGNRSFLEEKFQLPTMIEEESLSFQKERPTSVIARRLSEPLPWFQKGIPGNAGQRRIQPNLPSDMTRRDKEIFRQISIIEGDGMSCELPADAGEFKEDDPPYIVGRPTNQRSAQEPDVTVISNSPLMPGPFYTIGAAPQDNEPQRRRSIPLHSPVQLNRYMSFSDASGHASGLPVPEDEHPSRGINRIVRNEQSPSQELENRLAQGLFSHRDDNRSTRPPRKPSVVSMKASTHFKFGSNERGSHINAPQKDDVITNRDGMIENDKNASNQYNQRCHRNDNAREGSRTVAAKTLSRTGYTEDNEEQQQEEINRPTSVPLPSTSNDQGFLDYLKNSKDNDAQRHSRDIKHPLHKCDNDIDVKPMSGPSTRARMRSRPSVPSLKFALNELESLFSNQDLISAADRRMSGQSDSRAHNIASDAQKYEDKTIQDLLH